MYSNERELFNKINNYFNSDGSLKYTATEDIAEFFSTVGDMFISLVNAIKRYVPAVIKNIEKAYFKVTKKYDKLLELWNKDVGSNLKNVDTNKYSTMTIKVVHMKELLIRIDFIKHIQTTISDVRRICEDSSKDWKTVEIANLIKLSMDVGFDLASYNVSKELNKAYKERRGSFTPIEAGYQLNKISSIISNIDPIVKISRGTFSSKVKADIEEYSDHLLAKSKFLTSSTTISNSEKKAIREDLELKTIRLWWVAQFVNCYYTLLDDVLTDILTVCNAVQKCIDEES